MTYGQHVRYLSGTLRVGCWGCDNVMEVENMGDDDAANEEWLHQAVCPACGECELHAFGEFGCWPSEVGEPLCRRG